MPAWLSCTKFGCNMMASPFLKHVLPSMIYIFTLMKRHGAVSKGDPCPGDGLPQELLGVRSVCFTPVERLLEAVRGATRRGSNSRSFATKRGAGSNIGPIAAIVLATMPSWPAVVPARHYTTADGLARDSVHCIIRDRNSFLWFATGEGISRFDGYGFKNYRVNDGLPDRDVRSIVEAGDGSFLVATGGGAARFDPYGQKPWNLFEPFALGGGYKAHSVRAVLDAQGAVWIGTDAGLFVFRNHAAQMYRLADSTEQPAITSLARDSKGNLWVGTSGALYLLGAAAPALQLIRGPVSALLAESNAVLAATDAGLFTIGTDLKMMKVAPPPRDRTVLAMLRGRDGTLWVGTSSDAGQLDNGGTTYRWLDEKEGLTLGEVRGLAEDDDGSIWVGYDGAGAVRTSASGFVTYGGRDGLPPGQVASMALDRKGRLIAMVSDHPGMSAYRFENGRFAKAELGVSSRFYAEPWFPWHETLLEDQEGTWWSASNLGLLRLTPPGHHEKARLLSQFLVREGMPADDVAHVFQDSRGNIWFNTLTIIGYPPPGRASGLGMWERKTGRIRTFSEADGLPPLNSFAILYLFEDHAGQVWVGLHRTGVARYRNGRFEVFTAGDGIPAGGIRYVYEDQHKHLWLGSGRGGLGRIDDPTAKHLSIRHFSSAEGLASDEIQAITEDNFGRIYVGTGLGIDRIDGDSGRIVHYTRADGLAEGEIQDALRDPQGDLWFGTYKGISRLHPRPDPAAKSLPVRIAGVKVNGRGQPVRLGAQEITLADLPPGNNGLEIEFLALDTSGPENIRYQYRLDEGEEPWSAPTATRSVLFSNLRAGKHSFEVRTTGVGPSQEAVVYFTVQPHFWETWPFLVSATAVLFSILYAVHRYRMVNLMRMQRMRKRIANDLHDDIGSGLSKIVILSEVAQRDGKSSHAVALDRIAETSREVLDAVGDLVWTNNAQSETLGDLVRRMRSFATQLFEAKDVEFEMQLSNLPLQRGLSPENVRQLYLIFKEAVNNVARHSHCSHARVVLSYERGIFSMQVCDDGIGFTPAAKPGHHGLESLRVRAGLLKGTIEWRFESGTTVELNVPYLYR
jgi:ligand-binding sensor domain-containing protein